MQVQVSLSMEISASASVQQIEEQILAVGRASMRQALIESIREEVRLRALKQLPPHS